MDNKFTGNDLGIIATAAFIQDAHAGQMYGNMPYYLHPMQVADKVAMLVQAFKPTCGGAVDNFSAFTALCQVVALMHDVIEDTENTEAGLRTMWSDHVVDAVVLLSKDSTLNYEQNIQQIIDSGNIVAMFVKLADNFINRGGDKSQMDPARALRLNTQYDMSIGMLQVALQQRSSLK